MKWRLIAFEFRHNYNIKSTLSLLKRPSNVALDHGQEKSNMERQGGIQMNEYLSMKKELNKLEQAVAKKIESELISKCAGESANYLREATLDYLQQNRLPEEISHRLKKLIDVYISSLKIPVQEN